MLHHKTSRLMTKPTKWHVRPAKTQISLGIRPVWSESSLSAWRKLGSLATHWAHSEDSDQTGRMSRLIWVFAGRTCHFVGFVTRRLKSILYHKIFSLRFVYKTTIQQKDFFFFFCDITNSTIVCDITKSNIFFIKWYHKMILRYIYKNKMLSYQNLLMVLWFQKIDFFYITIRCWRPPWPCG